MTFASKNGWKLTKVESIPFENLSSIEAINGLLNKLKRSNTQFIKSISEKNFVGGKMYRFSDSKWVKVEDDISKEAIGYIIVDKSNKNILLLHSWGE